MPGIKIYLSAEQNEEWKKYRNWAYGQSVYVVDRDFTDDVLERANQLVERIGGELRSICIGHAPSELAKNEGTTTGGGTQYGHLRFAIPHSWRHMRTITNLSWLPDTVAVHTVSYSQGETTAFIELKCLIPASTRNVAQRLRWWNALLCWANANITEPVEGVEVEENGVARVDEMGRERQMKYVVIRTLDLSVEVEADTAEEAYQRGAPLLDINTGGHIQGGDGVGIDLATTSVWLPDTEGNMPVQAEYEVDH